ncbi:response regulator transcription factor [Salmonella enterica]
MHVLLISDNQFERVGIYNALTNKHSHYIFFKSISYQQAMLGRLSSEINIIFVCMPEMGSAAVNSIMFMTWLRTMIGNKKLVIIGSTGIDYQYLFKMKVECIIHQKDSVDIIVSKMKKILFSEESSSIILTKHDTLTYCERKFFLAHLHTTKNTTGEIISNTIRNHVYSAIRKLGLSKKIYVQLLRISNVRYLNKNLK